MASTGDAETREVLCENCDHGLVARKYNFSNTDALSLTNNKKLFKQLGWEH